MLNAYAPETTAVQLNLLDSHDTPRIRTLFSRDEASVRMAFLLQASVPGAPCVYYGDEIGLEGANDPDCRRAFPWDEAAWDQPTLTFVRSVLRLRHDVAVLRGGGLRIVGTSGDSLAILRSGRWDAASDVADGAPPALVVVNAGEGPVALPVQAAELAGLELVARLATSEPEGGLGPLAVDADGRLDLVLPARFGAVLLPA